jgi:nucleotide-binding universal stress UspA family protein
MKKIIVPTDFSKQAEYALDLACEVASRARAEIVLMHVIESGVKQSTFLGSSALPEAEPFSTGIDVDDIYFIQLFKRRKQQMSEVLNDPRYRDATIVDKIMLGTPYHSIVEEITSSDADFIIMGTTGVSDWEESLIGSTAEKVVRHARCPVLTLRNPVEMGDIRHIAYASDFKNPNPSATATLRELQQFFAAHLHLVFINTPGHFHNEREIYGSMKEFAVSGELINYETHVYCHRQEDQGIIWFTEDYGMNMIVMATEGRKGLLRMFEHSIAEEVVNFSRKPVVTINLGSI